MTLSCKSHSYFLRACVNKCILIALVRYIKILTWLWGFRVKITNFSRLCCLSNPYRGRDLSTNNNNNNNNNNKNNKTKTKAKQVENDQKAFGVILESNSNNSLSSFWKAFESPCLSSWCCSCGWFPSSGRGCLFIPFSSFVLGSSGLLFLVSGWLAILALLRTSFSRP